ncbi:FAD/NAD(P)-binding protein (plasmid) [Streptomyces sp. BI20]|uniref:FAD/NAD(P)-binding protein n=1 Tax=Streptomyces sp. BI20 TaxID=3403460 RepID=UPI003C7341E7
MSSGDLTVCIVGAGPRGLSVLERICANARTVSAPRTITVHVVDPHRPGPGRVWRTAQSRHLLMNTVASQVTVFTDDSVTMAGPVEKGPSLYEWCAALALSGTPAGPEGVDAAVLAEAARLGPDTYPGRALYGAYLEDAFDRIVMGAPERVRVRVHRTTAVALGEGGTPDAQCLTLADGTRLDGLDAVVLAQGHVPARPTPREARTAQEARALGLRHVLPANPADVDPSGPRPGRPVLLRGLGLNFFDHMALLTTGRGGRFERVDDPDGGPGTLVYRPSGREPLLYAGSRRGIPYHARGENEKGAHGRYHPRLLTPETIAALAARAAAGDRVHFGADVWPLVAREVESVYYGTLLTSRGRDAEREEFVDRYLATPAGEATWELLAAHRISADVAWSWEGLSQPYGQRVFADRAAFGRWLLDHLAADAREARAGNLSGPLKAALDVLRDLRNEIRLIVDHGGLEGNSHRDELQGWYTPLNAFLSIGPPVSRIEELAALMRAGIVELIGPGMRVRVDPDGPDGPAFEATSDRVGGEPVRADTLIEARLPEPDLRRTDDPLLAHLLATGQAAPYRIPGSYGTGHETGGLTVTRRPYHVVDAEGRAHPRRFAYGIPTEAVHWVTAAGIRPGVDSVTLGDSDAIARAVLDLTPAASPGRRDRWDADADLTRVTT